MDMYPIQHKNEFRSYNLFFCLNNMYIIPETKYESMKIKQSTGTKNEVRKYENKTEFTHKNTR